MISTDNIKNTEMPFLAADMPIGRYIKKYKNL